MERAAWVALSAVTGLGPARFRRLRERFGSALAALEATPEEVRADVDLPQSVLEQLPGTAARLDEIREQLASLDEQGIGPLIWEDAAYPSRLLATSSPPPVLWRSGPADLSAPAGAVAVVGSREASQQGCALARELTAEAVEAGLAVVSGLAAGIDSAAHEAAVEAGGETVGVCGCGLLTALTSGRGGLAARVAEAGALCSELSPNAPLLPQALHARDRIIAGLADAVIVVEARAEGGAVHTAKCALAEGRPVLAAEWPDGYPAAGNRQVLAEGARPLRPGEDLRAALARAAEASGR